jgi:hypothetical protein
MLIYIGMIFVEFYKLLYSTITIHEYVLAKFSNLLHFVDYWVTREKRAMTHSTKLMEARRKMRKEIMNCIVPCRRQTSMLDLQAIDLASNKENLPLALDPQRRRSSP